MTDLTSCTPVLATASFYIGGDCLTLHVSIKELCFTMFLMLRSPAFVLMAVVIPFLFWVAKNDFVPLDVCEKDQLANIENP